MDEILSIRTENMLILRKPYLVFLGDVQLKSDAKTGFGLRDWCASDVIGELALSTARVSLGLPSMTPGQAAAMGAGSLVVGVASVGGEIPEAWLSIMETALDAGLDIVSGMHTRLTSFPRLVSAATRNHAKLIDVRQSGSGKIPIGTGLKRSGHRLLTVGTDCALGKKYTALALTKALQARDIDAQFRATGQTGIMIAGEGIAIDAVVSDFVAGAAEQLSPANGPQHWDIIEGQGALFHPAFAAVTLGLLHGSQPDAIVMCHDPQRKTIEGSPHIPLPTIGVAIERYLDAARLTNAAVRCAGIAINSSSLDAAAWSSYRAALVAEHGLPVCDPIRDGIDGIADVVATWH